jgi:hypothetical protein
MKLILPIFLVILASCDSGKRKWTESLQGESGYVAPEDMITVCCYQYGPQYMYEVDSNVTEEFDVSQRCEKTKGTFNRGACDKTDTLFDGYCKIKNDVRFFYNVKDFTEQSAKSHCESHGQSTWVKG